MIDANQFLDIVQKPNNEASAFRLGKIDSAYSTGKPRIIFDGEEVSVKQYTYVANYSPVANDRVLLANVSGTYVILGKIL